MTLKITILGCGSSGGVPRIGDIWGACDPNNPRNRRRRCSVLVQRFAEDGERLTSVLIDTSPDMRAQLLDMGVAWLDGVLYTHDHADHTHGIDDLRMVAFNGKRHVDVHMSHQTAQVVMGRFSYCFRAPEGSPYPPILREHSLYPGKRVSVSGPGGTIEALPYDQEHGHIRSLGFRMGNVAYSCDVSDIPDESLAALEGLDVWIIDALRYIPHPSHFSLEDALRWIERVSPKRAILTNMHIDLDYDTLRRELPDNVEPAFDGLSVETVAELPKKLATAT
jgi:phosphoribosyl 1,2-cyclic phosphate phosphodiesterase